MEYYKKKKKVNVMNRRNDKENMEGKYMKFI